MSDVVVRLDVGEVYGRGDAGVLVEVAQVAAEVRVIDDAAEVALEVAVINGVETDEGAEEAPVGLDGVGGE